MKKIIKIIKTLRTAAATSVCCLFYYRKPLDNRLVAAQSRNGEDLAGNILCIMRELSKPEYGNFRFILSVAKGKKEHAKALLKRCGLKNVCIVRSNSLLSLCLTAKAKFILNDSTYPRNYVKKDGQIYLNTWHGTPLKHMGRDNAREAYSMGNVVRNLLQSDYILFPSEYMMNIMTKAYSLENLYNGTFLLEGYPRNSVFLNPQSNETRERLGVSDKQVVVYMPTWRGTLRKTQIERQRATLNEYFGKLDGMLSDSQIVYVKLHPLMKSKEGFSGYRRIRDFPDGYETYDVLNASDILVTDYSSVFYDYAVTGKKIILFTYDEDEYLKERGLYISLSALPFPNVKTVEELICEINSQKGYDEHEFLETYCPYEHADAAQRICKHIFLGEKVCREIKAPADSRKNILLYGGGLSKNGLTSAFLNMICHLDKNEYNYILSFRETSLRKQPERINAIPKELQIIPICSDINCTFSELLAEFLLRNFSKNAKWILKLQKRLYEREITRHFKGVDFSDAIQFCGYEQYIIEMFRYFNCNRIIYVHSDMLSEIKERKNQKLSVLRLAYRTYDTVAPVSKELIEPTYKISGRRDNIIVAPNFQDPEGITNRSTLDIAFERDTSCVTAHPGGIEGVLGDSGIKFITIGRFSPEKGHDRLISAFERFYENNPDAKLIIIGGHGKLFVKTLRQARLSPAWRNITIIRSVLNPMPILKRCDAFVMSSHYEGFPVVLFEAAILGLPAFGPDVKGIHGFMKEFGGYLYENSADGIFQGMNDFAAGKINPLKIDYSKYNNEAMAVFKSLLSSSEKKRRKA